MTEQVVPEPESNWGSRVEVDVMGVRVGTAETWDQESATATVFQGFQPNPGYEHFFPTWDTMDFKVDPFVGTMEAYNPATEERHPIPFGFHFGSVFIPGFTVAS
jgi:hypothetical protein